LRSKRRIFDASFKRRVLDEVAGGRSVAEVTRAYGLSKNAVCEWRNELGRGGEIVEVTRREVEEQQKRIADLERLVGRLSVENDILKKYRALLAEGESADDA
jgi:transposase